MKRTIALAALLAMIPALAHAADTVTLSVEGGIYRETISVGEPTEYYTVTVQTSCSGQSADAYIDANGVRTVIPNGEQTVYLRGVEAKNGTITIEAAAAPGETVTIDSISAEPGEEYTFYQGGDVTEANYILSLGGKYYAPGSGTAEDPIKILSDNGVNMARIRLSNSPGKGHGDGTYYLPDGFQDLDDCLDLARRANENDMAIEFTFNLSDYWSNAERQIVPSEWVEAIKTELGYDIKDPDFLKAMTDEERSAVTDMLVKLVSEHVTDVMTRLKEQGTTPEFVSIGNEVNGGLLFPFAPSFDMQMNCDSFEAVWGEDQTDNDIPMPAQTEALARIMNAGYDAVKAVSPETQVVLHLANGAKLSSYTWALDIYENAGTKYDVLGASYYPAWSDNTVEGCVEFCNEVAEKYGKEILIMETGFNWNATRKDGYPGQLVDTEAYKDKYPPTPEGQKGFIADLYNGLKSVNDGACIGAIYWDPLMIHVEDPETENASLSGWAYRESDDKPDGNVVENTTLFDFDGKALPVLNVTGGGAKLSAKNGTALENGLEVSDTVEIYGDGGTAEAALDGAAAIGNASDTELDTVIYSISYSDSGALSGVSSFRHTLAPGEAVTADVSGNVSVYAYANNEIIGYQFLNLGKVTDALKKGVPAAEAVEKAMGTYGQYAAAAKYIDPREE